MIVFPAKPWTDGQQFTHTTSDGTTLTGEYDSAKNSWKFSRAASFVEQEILNALDNSTDADSFYTQLKNNLP